MKKSLLLICIFLSLPCYAEKVTLKWSGYIPAAQSILADTRDLRINRDTIAELASKPEICVTTKTTTRVTTTIISPSI